MAIAGYSTEFSPLASNRRPTSGLVMNIAAAKTMKK